MEVKELNSLQDIIESIMRAIKLIEAANQSGLSVLERDIGTHPQRIFIKRESYSTYLEINGNCVIRLNLDNFKTIAVNFEIFYYVAAQASKYLQENLDRWEKDKEILSPYVLQEKLSN